MVTTRRNPEGNFPAFEPSPTKRSSRASTASPAPMGQPDFSLSPASKALAKRAASNVAAAVAPPSPSEIGEQAWCHTASNLTLVWLAVSLPLVVWDVLYMLLRPHTMSGGWLQWPIWKPYEVYASIDYVYGWPGYESGDGFGAAQSALNAIETVLYGLYLMIVYNHGVPTSAGTGVQAGQGSSSLLAGGRKVRGKNGNRALIIGFAAAIMTLSKTVLYYFNEYYSGFKSVAHNDWFTLFLFYGVMNGLWVALPAYMTVVFSSDMVKALDIAAETSTKKDD